MALRLGGSVEFGRLYNIKPYSTHGQLKLKGHENWYMIGLTGDMGPDLVGKAIAFSANPAYGDMALDPPINPRSLHPSQAGPTGVMTYSRWVRKPPMSTGDEMAGEAQAADEWIPCLYLEWFSQNGRVVIELPDPIIEVLVSDPSEDEEVWQALVPPPRVTEEIGDPVASMDRAHHARNAVPFGNDYRSPRRDGSALSPAESETADAGDEYGFHDDGAPADIDAYLDSLSKATDAAAGLDGKAAPEMDEDSDISDLIYMDEIMDGKHDSDPSIETVIKVPDFEQLSEPEAEEVLKEVLAQLALYGIAIDRCRHYSIHNMLRLIRDVHLPEAKLHAGLLGTGWVRHWDTWESCEQCEEEAAAEWKDFDPLAEGGESPKNLEREPDA